ncbi:MAG: hypothetical protein KKA90_00495 [Nanoarchaeota archaeon]|nr:hypothetical protein [Nanoarchaeota archaeon]
MKVKIVQQKYLAYFVLVVFLALMVGSVALDPRLPMLLAPSGQQAGGSTGGECTWYITQLGPADGHGDSVCARTASDARRIAVADAEATCADALISMAPPPNRCWDDPNCMTADYGAGAGAFSDARCRQWKEHRTDAQRRQYWGEHFPWTIFFPLPSEVECYQCEVSCAGQAWEICQRTGSTPVTSGPTTSNQGTGSIAQSESLI